METKIFIELSKMENGKILFITGGGTCNNGQMESHECLNDAMKDLEERIIVEYNLMTK